MKCTDGQFAFSASDVSTYLSCKHATQLHKQYALEGTCTDEDTGQATFTEVELDNPDNSMNLS